MSCPQPHGSKHQAEVKKLSERVRPEAGGAHSKSLAEMEMFDRV